MDPVSTLPLCLWPHPGLVVSLCLFLSLPVTLSLSLSLFLFCFLFSVYALFAYASCLVQSGFVTILIVVYPTSPPESLAETVPARR